MMNLRLSSRYVLLVKLLASPALLSAQQPHPLPPVRIDATFTQPDSRWPDSLRTRFRDSLTRGRERWRASRPPEYLVSVIATWGMTRVVRTPEFDGQLEAARVRGDSIVGIVHRPDPRYALTPDWRTVTIERVFLELERAVASPGRQIQVLKLDTLWGFPREWRTDDARNGYGSRYVTDAVSGGAIVFFEPVLPRSCGLIRRMLRRCRER